MYFGASVPSNNSKWTVGTIMVWQDKAAESSDPLVLEVCITSPDKQPRPAKVLAEDMRTLEWQVEKRSNEFQL